MPGMGVQVKGRCPEMIFMKIQKLIARVLIEPNLAVGFFMTAKRETGSGDIGLAGEGSLIGVMGMTAHNGFNPAAFNQCLKGTVERGWWKGGL